MDLTPEAVRALAPDGGALRAAQPLASPGRWTGLGRSARALWGACQGSGKDPYQVSVDLAGSSPAARCTCPSRKFPCKHALGLMLLAATTSAAVPAANPPSDVADWLQGRDARAKAGPQRRAQDGDEEGPPAVVDEKARARRIATRERRVDDGLAELRIWLRDLARRGLAEVASEGFKPFDSMAARLVDSQAPGIARALRGVGWRVAASGQGVGAQPELGLDWADDLLDVLGRQYLLLETYGRRESLSEATRAEARSLVGWTIREAELPDTDAISDDWLVLGRRHLADERLRATRTYLRGLGSGRDAVILEWEPSSSPALNDPRVGARIRAKLAFYPGAAQLRAVVRGTLEAVEAPVPHEQILAGASESWREAVAIYGSKLAASPWLDRWPVVVSSVVPALAGEQVVYRDGEGETAAILLVEPAVDSLRSFSGGYPVSLFGEWNGSVFTVLAAADATAWVALDGTTDDAEMVQVGRVPESDDPAWTELRRYATLGTSRASPGPELESLVARMADRSAEDQLLSLAASLAIRRRARPRLASARDAEAIEAAPLALASPDAAPAVPDAASARPDTAPAAPDSATTAPDTAAPAHAAGRPSPRAVHVLTEWLGEPVVVHDWLDRAASVGATVPAELLPRVAAVAGVTRRPDAEARLGPRWHWLSGLTGGAMDAIEHGRAAGSSRGYLVALDKFIGASGPAGLHIADVLRPFRRSYPDAARTWLESAWSNLPAAARDGALRALDEGLGPADAGLIDQLHEGERSKSRREQLATFACRVPGSVVGARIEARAKQLVRKRGIVFAKLDIQPPDADTLEAMTRDGMAIQGSVAGGTSAAQLQGVVTWHVARVAPARWLEWLNLWPPEMLGVMTSDQRTGYAMMEALRTATISHRDPKIAEAILKLISSGTAGWRPDGLWDIVPEDRRERLIAQLLFDQQKADSWSMVASLGDALAAVPRPWSPAFAGLVLQVVERDLGRLNGPAAYLSRARMKAIATRLAPNLLTELEDRVAAAAPSLANPSGLGDLLELIAARRSVDAAFATR